MTQTQRLLLAVGILAVAGVAANAWGPTMGTGPGDSCRRQAGDARRTCYSQLLSDRLRNHGVADAVATLDAIAAADSDAAEHAHEYSHGIGIEAFGISTDIPATFTACGDGFSSGCRHGVIQAYFESREEVTQPEVEALCQPFKSPTASRWVLFQCVHGMGHGLTMLYAHDLPRALTDCDMLADGWDRESCYGGDDVQGARSGGSTVSLLDHGGSLPARLLSDADVRHAESESRRHRRCGEVL